MRTTSYEEILEVKRAKTGERRKEGWEKFDKRKDGKEKEREERQHDEE